MKVHVVKKLTFFAGNEFIDTFHSGIFHGLAEREDDDDSGSCSYRMGDAYLYRLSLTINAYRISDIYQPRSNLVISEKLRQHLGSVSSVDLLEANVQKVIWVPYREGAFSHWDDPNYSDPGEGPENYIKQQPHRPELLASLSRFYELICPRHADIQSQFERTQDVVLPIGPTKNRPPFAANLSPEMLKFYPMLWHPRGFIFSESLFGIFAPFFNWHYFLHAECSL